MWHPSSVLICTFRHSSSNSSWVVTLMCILPYKIISVLLSLVSLFILVFYFHVAPPVWCSYALLGTLVQILIVQIFPGGATSIYILPNKIISVLLSIWFSLFMLCWAGSRVSSTFPKKNILVDLLYLC